MELLRAPGTITHIGWTSLPFSAPRYAIHWVYDHPNGNRYGLADELKLSDFRAGHTVEDMEVALISKINDAYDAGTLF